jgi:hypothetical protein
LKIPMIAVRIRMTRRTMSSQFMPLLPFAP